MYEDIGIEEAAPWLAIAITLLGGFLRVLLLDSKGMWLDETFSVWLANHSVVDMMHWIVQIDQHPPLYYLLLHYWIALRGDTPYDVRLLSVLFGAATIPIVYLIGRRLSGAVAGVAAAVLLALSPFHIFFAQETRMYTLLAFNAAVAIYALVRLLTDSRSVRPFGTQLREYRQARRTSELVEPGRDGDDLYEGGSGHQGGWIARLRRHRWRPLQTVETDLAWIVFVGFSAATMLSHNTAVLFPVAINAFVLGLMLYQRTAPSGSLPALQAPSCRNWVTAQIGIFVLWSPWMPSLLKQASAVFQRFWIPAPTWDAVIQMLRSFLSASGPIPASQAMAVWILYALVLCLGLLHYRKKMSQLVFLAALFAIPILGELIVSIRRPVFLDRTLIWITIPLFVVLAAGVAQVKYRLLTVVMLGSLGAINLFAAGDYYRFYQKEDWSTPAGYVALFAEKDDLVLFNSNFVEIPFDYYFKTYEEQYSVQVEKLGVPLDLLDSGVLEPMMTEADVATLVSLLRGRNRVWLVYNHNPYTDPMGLIPQTLAAQMKLTRTRDFYGGAVQLFETR